MKKIADVFKKYESFPEFIGIRIEGANQRGAVDNAPLHLAARTGDVEDIVTLIDSGANVDLPGDLGFTPLHFAALQGDEAVVRLLLRHGANPNCKNEFDQTPQDVAQLGQHNEISELLAQAG